jgi:hypothetical protein
MFVIAHITGPIGRAVQVEGLDRLDAEIVGLNPPRGMDVCFVFVCCVVLRM